MIIEIPGECAKGSVPRVFQPEEAEWGRVKYYVGDLLEDIQYNLTKQVKKALKYVSGDSLSEKEAREKAEKITEQFLKRIPDIRCMLAKDVQAAYDGDPAAYNTDEVIFSYPGVFAISVNRIAHELILIGSADDSTYYDRICT